MVMVLREGFEDGTKGRFSVSGSGAVGTGAPARSGTYRMVSASDVAQIASPVSELYFSLAVYPSATPSIDIASWLDSSGSILGKLRYNVSSNKMEAYTSTLVSTGTTLILPATWMILEFRVKIDDTSGVIQTKINGQDDINFSGDTKPGSNSTIAQFRLDGGAITYVDDVMINDTTGTQDNSWPGVGSILATRPDGAGTYTDIPSIVGATNHWEAVDEVGTDSDTTYVYGDAAALGAKDTYTFGNIPSLGSQTIKRVIIRTRARQDNSGTGKIATFIITNGAEYEGDQKTLTGSYAIYEQEYVTNPFTGAAWTEGEINGLQAGVVLR